MASKPRRTADDEYFEIASNWCRRVPTGEGRFESRHPGHCNGPWGSGGATSSRMSYNSIGIHSYHTVVGRLLTDANEKTVAVLTTHSYSPTTNRHLQRIRNACAQNKVDVILTRGGVDNVWNWLPTAPHMLMREAVEYAREHANAAKRSPIAGAAAHSDSARGQLALAGQYAERFGLEPVPLETICQIESDLREARERVERLALDKLKRWIRSGRPKRPGSDLLPAGSPERAYVETLEVLEKAR